MSRNIMQIKAGPGPTVVTPAHLILQVKLGAAGQGSVKGWVSTVSTAAPAPGMQRLSSLAGIPP